VESIFVLLPLALLIAAIAVGFFIWAARTGQFDDLDTPAVRILFDDEGPRRPAPRPSSALVRRSPGEGGDPTRRVSE
jgi:cbb3-type cytochrome oxidase maturation protein